MNKYKHFINNNNNNKNNNDNKATHKSNEGKCE